MAAAPVLSASAVFSVGAARRGREITKQDLHRVLCVQTGAGHGVGDLTIALCTLSARE